MSKARRVAIVHIGGEKTGTTTLQSTLALNRAALAQHGILYSRAAGRTNHILLPLYATEGRLTGELQRVSGLDDPGIFARFLDLFPEMLRNEANSSDAHTLIYSSEHLSSRLRDDTALNRFKALLSDVVDEVRLVYYARPQEELMTSLWSTMLKSGATEPFDPAYMLSSDTVLDHAALVERWSGCFGPDCWVLRPFQRASLEAGDIVADFCRHVGLPPETLATRSPALNRTLDAPRAEFLRLFNLQTGVVAGTPQRGGRGEVVRLLEQLSNGPPIHLPEPVLAEIKARFDAGNRALAQRFLGQPELFAAPTTTPASGQEALTVEGAVAIATALWELAHTSKKSP